MAKSVKLTWYGDDLQRIVERHNEPALWAAGSVVLDKAKRNAPRQSGNLARSGYIATERRTSLRSGPRDRKRLPRARTGAVVIAFAAWYSNLLEDSGAKPHTMRGRLVIPGIGVRARANHPGFRRKPFLGPALESTKDSLVREVAEVLGEEIERGMPHAR